MLHVKIRHLIEAALADKKQEYLRTFTLNLMQVKSSFPHWRLLRYLYANLAENASFSLIPCTLKVYYICSP